MQLRQCRTCLEHVVLQGFHKNRRSCKSCVNEKKKQHRRNTDWFEYIIDIAKHRARRRDIPFSITTHDMRFKWDQQQGLCALTGIQIEQKVERENLSTGSLDQIVPGEGYVPGNIQFVSVWANQTKSNLTEPEFRSRILLAAEFIKKNM